MDELWDHQRIEDSVRAQLEAERPPDLIPAQDGPQPPEWLWDDDRIFGWLKEVGAYEHTVMDVTIAENLAFDMRDSYEAKLREYQGVYSYYVDLAEKTDATIATLQRQLAEAQAWEPVPDADFIRGVMEATKERIKRKGTDVLRTQQWTMKRCDLVIAWLDSIAKGGDNGVTTG